MYCSGGVTRKRDDTAGGAGGWARGSLLPIAHQGSASTVIKIALRMNKTS